MRRALVGGVLAFLLGASGCLNDEVASDPLPVLSVVPDLTPPGDAIEWADVAPSATRDLVTAALERALASPYNTSTTELDASQEAHVRTLFAESWADVAGGQVPYPWPLTYGGSRFRVGIDSVV